MKCNAVEHRGALPIFRKNPANVLLCIYTIQLRPVCFSACRVFLGSIHVLLGQCALESTFSTHCLLCMHTWPIVWWWFCDCRIRTELPLKIWPNQCHLECVSACVFVCLFVCVCVCVCVMFICLFVSLVARPRTEQVTSPSRVPLSASRPARKIQVNDRYRFPGEFGERNCSLFFDLSYLRKILFLVCRHCKWPFFHVA